jgi:hypothetical protein
MSSTPEVDPSDAPDIKRMTKATMDMLLRHYELTDRLAGVIEILRSIEWRWGYSCDTCPKCLRTREAGHTPACTLSAALTITGHVEHSDTVELQKLRRVLDLINAKLPDIDETVYEYSQAGTELPGAWTQIWSGAVWLDNTDESYPDCILLTRRRRRRRVRRPPTDTDAVDQPRRPCWVRDYDTQAWVPAQLLAVVPEAEGSGYPFIAIPDLWDGAQFAHCEIEVDS